MQGKAKLSLVINNPNSKTENYTCIQTSFPNVNTNNASSSLRENVILTKLTPNLVGNMAPKCRIGGERGTGGGTPKREILTQGRILCQM